MVSLTFGSLFAGIGGIDLGLQRAGFRCSWQIEQDEFCAAVLENHWPEVPRYGDIRNVKGQDLQPVDLLCGGFPCQDLSVAGKRAGIDGTRSGLWAEFARLIGELRPRFVLIENVPGLLANGAMRRVLGDLSALGYDAVWQSLRASDFGAAHKRERVFILGILADTSQLIGRRESVCISRSTIPGSLGTNSTGLANAEREPGSAEQLDQSRGPVGRQSSALAHGAERGRGELRESSRSGGQSDGSHETFWITCDCISKGTTSDVSYATSAGLPQRETQPGDSGQEQPAVERNSGELAHGMRFAPGPSDTRWPAIIAERPDLAPALAGRLNPRFVSKLMGFSEYFTEVDNATNDKARSRKVLRFLQSQNDETEVQRNTRRLHDISEAEVLQSSVHGVGHEAGGSFQERPSLPDSPLDEECLRNVRDNKEEINASPHRQGLDKRRFVEYSNLVLHLSHFLASCSRGNSSQSTPQAMQVLRSPDLTAYCVRHMQDADKNAWDCLSGDEQAALLIEAATAAQALSNRTSRLKALGNSVVPDGPEWIVRKLLEILEKT